MPSASSGDGGITYSSSNSSIASISGSTVIATGGGTATITASISAGTNYLGATTSYTITCTDVYHGYEYVNLDLPSGTLWAKCNVGSSTPEGLGNYYQYGKGARDANETTGEANYNINATSSNKYLAAQYDTASSVMHGSWHQPTANQCLELTKYCWYSYIQNYNNSGINVYKFWSKQSAPAMILLAISMA